MASNTTNPFDFTSFFKDYDPKAIVDQMQSMFGNYSLPNFDQSALVNAQSKNIEALAAANQAAIEGTQTLLQRQAEMFQKAMDDAAGAAKSLSESADMQEAASKQTEIMQAAFETALSNSTELSEMVKKSQDEMSDVVTRRIAEGLEEVKETISKIK